MLYYHRQVQRYSTGTAVPVLYYSYRRPRTAVQMYLYSRTGLTVLGRTMYYMLLVY
eukprot:COSAG01_NODE_55327_length_326_cov_0.475771_1_plen_55_part_10